MSQEDGWDMTQCRLGLAPTKLHERDVACKMVSPASPACQCPLQIDEQRNGHRKRGIFAIFVQTETRKR
jgi:hypothetical protein